MYMCKKKKIKTMRSSGSIIFQYVFYVFIFMVSHDNSKLAGNDNDSIYWIQTGMTINKCQRPYIRVTKKIKHG